MSQNTLSYINSSTSFTYDVEGELIKNERKNSQWINELADICNCLSEEGIVYNIDGSYNITNLRIT